MGKINKELRGVPAILRANAIDLVVFGAVQFQVVNDPGKSIDDIIQNVLKTFGLSGSVSPGSLKTAYYRNLETFLKTGL